MSEFCSWADYNCLEWRRELVIYASSRLEGTPFYVQAPVKLSELERDHHEEPDEFESQSGNSRAHFLSPRRHWGFASSSAVA